MGFVSFKRLHMLYTPLTKKAMKLAFEAHEGQVDKAGIPYINHPLHVAEQVEGEYATCVALLHDVLEDTDYEADDIRAMGFPEEIVQALLLLTHREGVAYLDYVRALADSDIARQVKIADLRHNSDLGRLDTVDDAARARVAKYAEALAMLGAHDNQ